MKLEVARPIGQALTAVSLFLFLVPLVNVGLQVIPWRPSDQNWRFGALGFLLGAITLPTLGVGLLGVSGLLRESRGTVRLTFALASLLLVAAVAGLADFLIEGSALKAAATEPRMLRLFQVEIRRTTLVSAVAIPALAALAIGSYKLLSGMRSIEAENQGSSPLIRTGAR
jgi:hypothetical protein